MKIVLQALVVLLFAPLFTFASGPADVKLVHAEGRIYYHEIYVTWSTEFEEKPCDFLVEASMDGSDWRIRGRVKSNGKGAGISEYQFIDNKQEAFQFYRIRKHDPHGSSQVLKEFALENYSINVELEALEFVDERRLVLEYTIDKDQELMIRIYNRIGEQVMTKVMPFKEAGEYIFHLDISHLRRDNYLLQVTQVLLDKAVAERAFKVN